MVSSGYSGTFVSLKPGTLIPEFISEIELSHRLTAGRLEWDRLGDRNVLIPDSKNANYDLKCQNEVKSIKPCH